MTDGSSDTREEARNFEIIGLDRAERAVAFAEEIGLIDDGVVENLEEHPLPDVAMPGLADVDLMTSTGCIGYVTEKAFERLLPAVTKGARAPWMANFVLRLWSFESIEATLSDWGYVTEKLPARTFKQRRFVNDEEREQVLVRLRERGIDPSDKEAEGHLHAEFHLSRPTDDIRQVSLDTLLVGHAAGRVIPTDAGDGPWADARSVASALARAVDAASTSQPSVTPTRQTARVCVTAKGPPG